MSAQPDQCAGAGQPRGFSWSFSTYMAPHIWTLKWKARVYVRGYMIVLSSSAHELEWWNLGVASRYASTEPFFLFGFWLLCSPFDWNSIRMQLSPWLFSNLTSAASAAFTTHLHHAPASLFLLGCKLTVDSSSWLLIYGCEPPHRSLL